MSFLVTSWAIPYTGDPQTGGLVAINQAGDDYSVKSVSAESIGVYWAAKDPLRSSLILLHNDAERSSMSRMHLENDGAVSFSDHWPSGGEGGSFISFHPNNEFFIVSNSHASWAVFGNDDVPRLVDRYRHQGSGPHPRQAQSHPHSAIFSPDGLWVYAADMGSDEVLSIQFDPNTGKLGEVVRAYRAEPGSGPRHVALGENVLYVFNELGNTLEVLKSTGPGTFESVQKLSTIPDDYKDFSHGSQLTISANGQQVYVGNRGHDSIAIFDVQPDGLLRVREWVPSGGSYPWHFLMTPDQKMLVANNQSNLVSVFNVGVDGSLTFATNVPVVSPAFIIAIL